MTSIEEEWRYDNNDKLWPVMASRDSARGIFWRANMFARSRSREHVRANMFARSREHTLDKRTRKHALLFVMIVQIKNLIQTSSLLLFKLE